MGGDCIGSDLVKISTGYDFVQMVIETALGKEPSFEPVREPKYAVIRFIFTKKDLEVLQKIQKEKSEILYFVSEIEPVGEHEVVDSSTRFGYFIAACDTRAEAEEILE